MYAHMRHIARFTIYECYVWLKSEGGYDCIGHMTERAFMIPNESLCSLSISA